MWIVFLDVHLFCSYVSSSCECISTSSYGENVYRMLLWNPCINPNVLFASTPTIEYDEELGRAVKGNTSGSYQQLCMELVKGERDTGTKVDKDRAQKDAAELYQVGIDRAGWYDGEGTERGHVGKDQVYQVGLEI